MFEWNCLIKGILVLNTIEIPKPEKSSFNES